MSFPRVIATLAAVVSTACGSPSGSGGPATSACLDEVGDPSGGDSSGDGEDSCLFVPYCADEDEGPTDKLDFEVYPDSGCPGCAPPPPFDEDDLTIPSPEWERDLVTDTYYRYATELELEMHDWPVGTTLFAASNVVDALTQGSSSTVTLALPLANQTGEISLTHIAVEKKRTRSDAWYVESEASVVGPIVSVARPEFYLFLPSWVDFADLSLPLATDVFIWMFADSHGGVAIQGMTASQEFSVLGPTTQMWLETRPPGSDGFLVVKPEFRETGFDAILGHWVDVLAGYCDEHDCLGLSELDPNIPIDPGNCGDCIDNDSDIDVDTGDIFCQHRVDFGCPDFDPHTHRWENSKDFAMLPDIVWCTQMHEDGMPWQTELYHKATSAAGLLNAIPMALEWMHGQELELEVEVPTNLPTIRYRLAYCVVAEDIIAADACRTDENACPPQYHMGGLGPTIDPGDENGPYFGMGIYFAALWNEFDEANHALEAEGIAPKPVAMLSSYYSGTLAGETVGYTGSIGGLSICPASPPPMPTRSRRRAGLSTTGSSCGTRIRSSRCRSCRTLSAGSPIICPTHLSCA